MSCTFPSVEQYQPCGLVTLRQLCKLEMGIQQIDVLTQLIPHIESFKDMAGFMLNERNADHYILCSYGDEHPLAAYICSWQFEENPMREPTWKNFLYILGEIGLKSLATRIESFLQDSNYLVVTEENDTQMNSPAKSKFTSTISCFNNTITYCVIFFHSN